MNVKKNVLLIICLIQKKGGYKPSKFTKFMKNVNVDDEIDITLIKTKLNLSKLNIQLDNKQKKNLVNQKKNIARVFLLNELNVHTTKEKKKLKLVNKNLKSTNANCIGELKNIMDNIGFKKYRNCYSFEVINNNNSEKIGLVTFTKGKKRRGFCIINDYLYIFNTDDEDNFKKVEKKTNTKNTKKTNTPKKKVTIYWIRHAWSCGNLLQYYKEYLKMPKLAPDANLSGLGILQSQLLGYNKNLKNVLKKADMICSSELKRAMQTALYAKMYSGNSGKTLNIIPQTNEKLLGGKKIPEPIRVAISRTATPISYYSMDDYNKIINEFQKDYGQNISMEFYNEYYKTGNPKMHRKQQIQIINSSHKNFRRNVLPELLKCDELKEKKNPVLVIFGHGKYIAGILEEVCRKDCRNKYLIKLKKEGIYNTGIYKVNYEYSDYEYRVAFQTEGKENSIERLFPTIDGEFSLNKVLKDNGIQSGGEYNVYGNLINNQNNKSRGKHILRTNNKNKNLNNNINNGNNNRPNNNGTTLTEYRNKLANYMEINTEIPYTLFKDTNSDLMFYLPVLDDFIKGLPKIPIILTGQKTGEDKKPIRQFWLDNADLFIGDSVGYTANKARYTNKNIQRKRLTKQSKYDHGCLIDLKKYLLKDKSRNFNITNLNEDNQERIEIIFNLYFYIKSKIEEKNIQNVNLPKININALKTEKGRENINRELREIIQNLNKKKIINKIYE